MISEEELKKTFLEKEVPEQQGEEPVDEFRHDLLGKKDPKKRFKCCQL